MNIISYPLRAQLKPMQSVISFKRSLQSGAADSVCFSGVNTTQPLLTQDIARKLMTPFMPVPQGASKLPFTPLMVLQGVQNMTEYIKYNYDPTHGIPQTYTVDNVLFFMTQEDQLPGTELEDEVGPHVDNESYRQAIASVLETLSQDANPLVVCQNPTAAPEDKAWIRTTECKKIFDELFEQTNRWMLRESLPPEYRQDSARLEQLIDEIIREGRIDFPVFRSHNASLDALEALVNP